MPDRRTPTVFTFDDYVLDVARRTLRRGADRLDLKGKAFDVLVHLVRNQNVMVSKESIFDEVWMGSSVVFDTNLVDQALSAIRRAVGREQAERFLTSERGRGIAFVGAARPMQPKRSRVIIVLGSLVVASTSMFIMWRVGQNQESILQMTPRPITATGLPKFGPFVGDSKRIYYTEYGSGSYHISWTDLKSGATGTLNTVIESPAIAGISRNRKTLLVRGAVHDYHADGPLYLLSIDTLEARPLNVKGFDGDWTADGRALLFTVDNEIRSLDLLSGQSHIIVKQNGEGIPWWPRTTALSDVVRYSVFGQKPQFSTTWELNLKDGSSRPLFLEGLPWHSAACGDWSDTNAFYFQVGKASGPFTIWSAKSTNTPPRILTAPGPFNFQFPSTRVRDGYLYMRGQYVKTEIYAAHRPDGRLEPYQPDLSPAFSIRSPDHRYSATYQSSPIEQLILVNLSTGEQKVLVPPPAQSAVPAWSPDSQKLAVPVRMPGSVWKIVVINIPTGASETLNVVTGHSISPSWLAGGNEIVFGGIPSTELGHPVMIMGVNLRSRQVRLLEHSEGLFRPATSPDGTRIAAIDSVTEEIHILTSDKGRWERTGVSAGYIQWTRDGTGIRYLHASDGAIHVKRLTLSPRSITDEFSIRGFKHFAPWFDAVDDSAILIPKDLSTQEIYELELR